MSSNRHRREDHYSDLEHRDRYRERRRSRSRSRTPERYHRRRRSPASRSRSRSADRSSGRNYASRGDKRSARFTAASSRRQSVSRSRSKSRTRRSSRSHSPTSHTRPTNSNNTNSNSSSSSRPTHNSEHKSERTSNRQTTETHSNRKATTNLQEQENKSSYVDYTEYSVEDLPLPKKEAVGAYYNLDTDEPIDKERIHREMEEKLRATLAKEGKVYPPPKPEPSHPVFANDGSFIEIFKKMQQAQQSVPAAAVGIMKPVHTLAEASTSTAAAYVAASAAGKPAPPPPIVGRRRGGKILKTGLVAKPKAQGDDSNDPKDFWTIYLREVNKYKNNACDSDGGTRPLVK